MSNVVHCSEHGASTETFVCVHVAESLRMGRPSGFVYTSLDAADEPCAYCSACDEMLRANGDSWTQELEQKADIKLLCYECFLKAARLNGVLN